VDTPADLFRAGRLQAALDAQLAEVKAHPADAGRRLFLFELAVFAGDDARARRQLDALPAAEHPAEAAAIALYHQCLDAADRRRQLFAAGTRPELLAPAPEHVTLRLDALDRFRAGHPDEATDYLVRADEAARPVAGVLNGAPVADLRDGDDRFGPVLEVFARGKYVWVALEQIDAVTCNPPKYPRDLLWLPAKLMAASGETGDVFLPALYPDSAGHPDEAVRLGRTTDWSEGDGPVFGRGGRVFVAAGEARPLLDWRQLEVTPQE
jgi:type VI secretion system protein ImpE